MTKIPVEVSARHCHLTPAHIQKLFGKGYQLKVLKMVSQPGQYATQEEVTIKGPKGELRLRIVAPERLKTQIELSATECIRLGIKPALRLSGDLAKTPGATLIGPKGSLRLSEGVIVAKRHVHLEPKEAIKLQVKTGQTVKLKISGPRGLIFDKVIVRSGPSHHKAFQIDTDEGNACGWTPGQKAEIVK